MKHLGLQFMKFAVNFGASARCQVGAHEGSNGTLKIEFREACMQPVTSHQTICVNVYVYIVYTAKSFHI